MSQQSSNGPGIAQQNGWRGAVLDLVCMIRFYSRLPMPRLPFEAEAHAPPDFRRAPRMLPLAGLVIGLPGALILAFGALALPATIAAVLAVAMAALVSGAFHEDGLADTFDGLGGGWTPERRLEIMRDSRIGSYGGAALMLALIARVSCLAALAERSGALAAAAAMLGAASLSRPAALMPLALLPPARPDGASALVGRPGTGLFVVAIAGGFVLAAFLMGLAGLPFAGSLLGLALALAACAVMTRWASRSIGGQTGDIAGACQQMAEIAIYVGMLMVLGHDNPISLRPDLPHR